ncbi:MAG: DUF4870 domain-containing protein, partial [Candidatus Dojkabacteria bacterium]
DKVANKAEEVESKAKQAVGAKSGGSGLDPNIAGLLAWLFAPITSVVFLITDPDDEFIRFHSMQSLIYTLAAWAIFTVVYTIISIVTLGIGALCCLPLAFIIPIVNIYGAIKAYNGEMWELPYIGEMSKKK